MMRSILLFSALSVLGVNASLAAGPAASAMHVGPVYTGAEGNGEYPVYPDVEIEVDVPPEATPATTAPGAFQLKVDEGSPVTATRVQSLADTGFGVAASVALDVSGSMKGEPLNAVRTGLLKFVNDKKPQDRIAIQTIADSGRWDSEWNDSPTQVQSAIQHLAVRGTRTRLWDSLLEAINHFQEKPISRRLIVISDGHDEGSSHKEQDVISAALNAGIVVDAIGVTRSNPVYLKSLDTLATQTGGHFRQAKDTKELESLVGNGIQRLEALPVVSFTPEGVQGDGAMHRFDVTWIHDGVNTQAQVAAVVPTIKATATKSSKRWIWISSGAVLLLLLLVIALRLGRKSKREAAYTGMPVPVAQPYVAPPPSGPPPPRKVTESQFPGYAAGAPGVAPRPISAQPQPVAEPRRVEEPQQPVAARPRAKTEVGARFGVPASGRPAAWLYCESGFSPGTRFPVEQSEYWIGALENNHLRIPDDPTVSGNHACLLFDHEVLGIYDHKSTNGTRINGELLRDDRKLLRPGDRVRIGQSTFVVQAADQDGARS